MKLTIDIPEQIYLNAKEDLLCGGDVIVKAIKNGKPHETVTEFADRCRECGREVLDKIRTEIESHCGLTKENHCRYCSYCNSVMGVREILEIIDKYKAESEE